MADIELVEQLRKRANVTYDEAKEALDNCGDDLLDAVIYLERQGRVPPPSGGGAYSSKNSDTAGSKASPSGHAYHKHSGETFSAMMRKFSAWLLELLKKSMENKFEVSREGQLVLSVPVLVLVVMLIFCFWFTIPFIIVGLFFNCRYSFSGKDMEDTGINNIMNEVANAAENIKSEVKVNCSGNKDQDID